MWSESHPKQKLMDPLEQSTTRDLYSRNMSTMRGGSYIHNKGTYTVYSECREGVVFRHTRIHSSEDFHPGPSCHRCHVDAN